MPVSRRRTSRASIACACALLSGVASAEEPPATNAECARAYEDGQVSRKSGRLLNARSELLACSRDECPDFIRSDCSRWYAEVQTEIPTVVFAARSNGQDLIDVQISLGDRSIASRIDGQTLELDPGEYDFAFAAPGMQTQAQHAVVVRGERNRLIEVELVPVPVAAPQRQVEPPLQLARSESRSLLVPSIFAGIGVVGLAGFASLGAVGRANESRLESSCAPACSEQQMSEVRTQYLLADVSLGVGVASLALGAYFLFRQPSSPTTGRVPALNVQASAQGASFLYGGKF